ncbi:hypothetical protein CYLTODRAFT_443664 [Cylindrobasidium torrendii FP15055 ss-10]|uniref:Transmembrane protein n=1 Tax=Cylindrobasidium torrendii FP15055 ss-10 TaxID=1314674 RepID=A0A0D7BBV1_9AGAR|nr:hypothetical protein CYLTODRAFT_443664 [Cylindrobasidium torrendii FP15055 ss-10]
MTSSVFPSAASQVGSALIHLFGVSILAHCFSQRLMLERIGSWADLRSIPWPRICLLLIFLDSWCFLCAGGILIFGIGLETKDTICAAGIFICVIFYSTSKLLIYAFLIERVYIVWSPANLVGRLKSRVYIISLITVISYGAVIILMVIGRIAYLRETDQACIIGLKSFSSIPLLAYDLYITIFLTTLFLWPLLRRNGPGMNDRVKQMGKRALLASGIALATSTVNIAILAAMRGHQLGWVCLGSCGADVIVNASSLFWASGKGSADSFDERPAVSSNRRLSRSTEPRSLYISSRPERRSAMGPITPPDSPAKSFWWNKKEDHEHDAGVQITITTDTVAMEDYASSNKIQDDSGETV